MEIDRDKMQNLCDEWDIDTRWDYSGRFMYGKRCFGIVGGSRDMSVFLLNVLPKYYSTEDVPADWYENARDNMANDMIFYWPDIEAAPEPPHEDIHPLDARYDGSDDGPGAWELVD
jgi:hypothetical protein